MSKSEKAPITDAVEQVVRSVLVPTLKERGFRKQRHHWWGDTDATHRAVTVQSSQYNSVANGRFTIEIGVSYPCVGEDRPNKPGALYCRHRERIGFLLQEPHDLWWSYEDARDPVERLKNEDSLREVWSTAGLPFLDRVEDPTEYMEYLLREPAAGPPGIEAIELAQGLGSQAYLDRAIDGYLTDLRSDHHVHTYQNPFSVGDLAVYYAELLPHLHAAGRSLTGDDLERAHEAVTETVKALEAGHQHYRYRHHNRAGLLNELGDLLGIETSPGAPHRLRLRRSSDLSELACVVIGSAQYAEGVPSRRCCTQVARRPEPAPENDRRSDLKPGLTCWFFWWSGPASIR
ncbi:MAG: DUF4304 domain-containing protein [Acidimicrobiales bacterium]